MEGQLTDLVHNFETSNDIQREILKRIERIKIEVPKIEGPKIDETINRKFIVKIDVESCFRLLSENLRRDNVNRYKVNINNNLNHICIFFQEKSYLEIFITPIEKDISEININGINIRMDYFQNYLQTINNILSKK